MDMKDHADDLARRRARAAQMVRALEMARSKRVERPWRKHGVMPV
jgi:hypothetical protein